MVSSDTGANLNSMADATCERCGGAAGESTAWHDSVVEPGDLDLVEHKGQPWHRKCAEDDRLKSADAATVKRDAAK